MSMTTPAVSYLGPEQELDSLLGQVFEERRANPTGFAAYAHFLSLVRGHPLRERMMSLLASRGFDACLNKWRPPAELREQRQERSSSQAFKRTERRAYAQRHGISFEDVPSHRAANAAKVLVKLAENAVLGARVTEFLDRHLVDGKRLGDCTADVLVEASESHERLSSLYAALAPLATDGRALRDADSLKLTDICAPFLASEGH